MTDYTLPVLAEDRHERRAAYFGTCSCGARVHAERSKYAPLVSPGETCPACSARMTITKGGL